MSDRSLRRRIPATYRRPRSSLSSRRLDPASNRKASRPIEILNRSKSESNLLTSTAGYGGSGDSYRNMSAGDNFLYRPSTCTDLFSPGGSLSLTSPGKLGGYTKDAKVVVNVTVEGSPGPVRTLVKLGENVEETIRLVIKKYTEEGRTPLLDKDAALYFHLHHSNFSLSSLRKSDVIGEAGTRSFYLCRGNNSAGDIITSSFTSSDIDLATPNTPPPADPSHFPLLPRFIFQKIQKFIRRSRKLWKIFGCLQCN